MPKSNSRMIFTHDKFNFNCEVFNGFCIICMCDANFSAGVTFNFINDIKTKWFEMYTSKNNGGEELNDMNDSSSGSSSSGSGKNNIGLSQSNLKSFKSVLQKRMHFFNTDPSANKIKRLKNQIADVKEEMVNNIEKTLLRGEKIELLVDRTNTLRDTATNFKGKSKTLKRSMIGKWIAVAALIIFLFLGLGSALFFYLCGGIKCIESLKKNKNSG